MFPESQDVVFVLLVDGSMGHIALAMLALACSLAAVAISGRRTPSAVAQAALKETKETRTRWETECALFAATRDRWTQEFDGIAQRCDELLDRTESKRRRIAATASRENAATPANGDPWAGMSREEIITTARRQRVGLG
jgi:hypothetical protein